MNKILILIIICGLTFSVYAADYSCDADTVDFNQGDVLSSEVLSDIIDKINNNIVGISQSEMNASWSCKSILDRGFGTVNGYSEDANGFYTMTQTLTFTEVDSIKSRVIYENNLGNGGSQHPAQDWTPEKEQEYIEQLRLLNKKIENSESNSESQNQLILDS